jgi:hypothetical protein
MLRLYWLSRILAYALSLPGVFIYLYNKGPNPPLSQRGLALIGIGFVFFFISYALRIAIRAGLGKRRPRPDDPSE